MGSKQSKNSLQELVLLDRFLFSEAAEDQQFLQTVLEIIFEDEIVLKYPPQAEKEMRGGLQQKKIRFDVWDMDESDVVYDTEVQKTNTRNLPKRSRYYQGLIDSKLLPEGTIDYNKLNDAYVILISPFDLFGKGRYRYTFHMMCEEFPGMKLNDGAVRMFLNTRGTDREGVSEELIAMLKYFETTTVEMAEASGSDRIRSLHNIVESIRNSEEIGVKYMNALEEKILDMQEAFEQGEASGFEKGEASGFEKGEIAGLRAGEEKVKESQRTIAARMLKKDIDKADIAEVTGLSMEEIEALTV